MRGERVHGGLHVLQVGPAIRRLRSELLGRVTTILTAFAAFHLQLPPGFIGGAAALVNVVLAVVFRTALTPVVTLKRQQLNGSVRPSLRGRSRTADSFAAAKTRPGPVRPLNAEPLPS